MLCADVVCSKGKETMTAPTTPKAFSKTLISLRHRKALQIFIWKDLLASRSCAQNPQKVHFGKMKDMPWR